MDELKHTKKTIIEVDSSDFDYFVGKKYGGDFDFVADHEASNNSSYTFTVPNANMDFGGKYEAKIRSGEFYNVPVHALFNLLFKDGYIEKGEYLINVYW